MKKLVTFILILCAILTFNVLSATQYESSTYIRTSASSSRGLLTIKFINSEEKPFNLTTAEIDNFIKWYNDRDSGKGDAYYILIEPSKDRSYEKCKVYVLHDKILYFSVSEFK